MAEVQTNGGPPAADSKVPAWLKQEIFEEHLRKHMANFKTIQSFKAMPAMAAGENYATIMLRIEIEVALQDGKTKDITLMMKVPHQLPMFREMMKKHNMFDVETLMYRDVVPEFEEMYRKAGVELRFGANYYDVKTPEDLGVITLEDLRPAGFKNANRLEGLDEEHTKCALRRLAQWHAASAVRVATKGNYVDKVKNGSFTKDQREVLAAMLDGISVTLRDCLKLYDAHEGYEEKVRKLQPRMLDELFKAQDADPNEFNVLNHGDFWCNNIMYQYDAFGKIKETYLVDFQLPKYGHPAQDLLYFLLSSTKYELKLSKFEYFIKFYHDILIENLKLLKYPKKLPTLSELHSGLYKYGIWGFFAMSLVMGAVLLEPTENASIENFVGEGADAAHFHRLMYSNARYCKHAGAILQWLNNRGALDC